ncbi:chorion peroxidase [Drosophila ficusphila]|uniref:chorion peroxidase n=1 Tax=Drosophila ficusphila TaxID=30025 RepID=UPI0007E836C5|nr:chorion peroxidase [Drosophila ficusphila]
MTRIWEIALLLIATQIGGSLAAAFSVRQNRFNEAPDLQTPVPLATSTESTKKTEKVTSGLLKKCLPCNDGIKCVPQIQCPAHVRMESHEKPQICDLPAGKFGFCCETGQNHTAPKQESSSKERRSGFPTILPISVLDEARRQFEHLMNGVSQIPVRRGFPDFAHGLVFHSTAKDDLHNFAISNSAIEQVMTTQLFGKKEQVPVDDFITNNVPIKFTETPLAQHCQPPLICRNVRSVYRSLDGTCNNPLPQRSLWGAAGQPMERLLPPAYEDGIWTPRSHSSDGTPLLSARKISRILLADVDRPHPLYNLLVMQFGQVLAHDISQTSSVRLEDGSLVQCCSADGNVALSPQQSHFACMPIHVEPDDEFFAAFGVRCLNFVRLSLVPSPDCQLSYGKQMSKVTHYVDASPVYGSSDEASRSLRAIRGGRLRMLNDFGRDLLPLTNDKKACPSEEAGKSCFLSGDGRTNQIISLITLQILLAREHNRVAEALNQLNPSASDEWLFQEARRIVVAEVQHITYNEFLPIIIGPQQMKRFGLVPLHQGYSHDYNVDVNPSITNEFSGAAYRMGHSSVDGKFQIRQEHGRIDEVVNIPDVMFNPSRMRKREFYDDMLRTLYSQPMQQVDNSISHGLSRFLFRGDNPFGLDLAAINIQRGRDQGLRSYNDYLELRGAPKLESFEQFPSEIGQKLARVYRSPDDIDLWVGGLLEQAVDGGVVGATFAEIIADQFARFKQGDRYFYEYDNNVNPGAFTPPQLQELRKATLARLLCDNSDRLTLQAVPLAAFIQADHPGNQVIGCDDPSLPAVNLEAWRT